MTSAKSFKLSFRTKAGEVTGTVTLCLSGPTDGLASAMEKAAAHLKAMPGAEVNPAVPATWESETMRLSFDGVVPCDCGLPCGDGDWPCAYGGTVTITPCPDVSNA